MILHLPGSIKSFAEAVRRGVKLTGPQRGNLAMVLSGILLGRNKRSLAELGRTVVERPRYRGSVSRFLAISRLRTRDLCRNAARLLIRRCSSDRGPWILAIDGVCCQRGSYTKIANAQQYKRKAQGARGGGSKSFTFVMGVLISSRGDRIPLPRKTWRTRSYARSRGKRYKSQVDLACLLVEEARRLLRPKNEILVVADAFFSVTKLHECCEGLGITYIFPLASNRCFDRQITGRKKKIVNRARRLRRDRWEEFTLVSGTEETASYRRYSAKERRAKKRRCYRVASETRTLSGLGEVLLVYSWKSPVYTARGPKDDRQLKTLATNNRELSAAQVVELYELRWQIELFFRELKSGLGLADYQGTDFQAYERWIDFVLLAFMCLEWSRLDQPPSQVARQLRTEGGESSCLPACS